MSLKEVHILKHIHLLSLIPRLLDSLYVSMTSLELNKQTIMILDLKMLSHLTFRHFLMIHVGLEILLIHCVRQANT